MKGYYQLTTWGKLRKYFCHPETIALFPIALIWMFFCTQYFAEKNGQMYFFKSIFDNKGSLSTLDKENKRRMAK